jgi:DNA-directed RNA polymerase subunit RPC12/RpoP
MTGKCPGNDSTKLSAAFYKCQHCGAEVEMFSDELKIKCKKCGNYVYKEKVPSCVDWCSAARRCLGEERWQELKGSEIVPGSKK